MYKIQTVTAGSAVASLDFTVPSGYDDLMIVASLRSDRTSFPGAAYITINGNAYNATGRVLYGDQTSSPTAQSYSFSDGTIGSIPSAVYTASTFGNLIIYIPNYRSNTAKSYSIDYVTENNGTQALMGIVAGIFSDTNPITSITLDDLLTNNFVTGSTATLYGIRKYNTTGTPKATGGQITYANGYWVHSFTASGTFTPSQNLTDVEYLVIAGGGASSSYYSGGGGAGGYRSSVVGESSGGGASAESRISLTSSTAYTITVGAGGAGPTTNPALGSNGSNSSIAGSGLTTITATGGGAAGGDGAASANGVAGGSGGGGALGGGGTTRTGGAGTTGQGYAGGSTTRPGLFGRGTGGGGGAGAVGVSPGDSSNGGAGGIGVQSSITGVATYRAGGGGGLGWDGTPGTGQPGAGGLGGGGLGGDIVVGSQSNGLNGAPNTGGGAGGSFDTTIGTMSSGGSGIVIIRYAA